MKKSIHIGDDITRADLDAKHHEVTVLGDADDLSGWAARLTGVDPSYGFARIFLAPRTETPDELGLVTRSYTLKKPGLYQLDTPKLRAHEHVFILAEPDHMHVLTDEERVRQILRGEAHTTLADVLAHCLHMRWSDAERAATNLPTEAERQEAAAKILDARTASGADGLGTLDGTPRQLQWARAVRAQAATRLAARHDELGRELQNPDNSSARTHELLEQLTALASARARLYSERDARFWISHRHELEAEDERFFYALISGEPFDISQEQVSADSRHRSTTDR